MLLIIIFADDCQFRKFQRVLTKRQFSLHNADVSVHDFEEPGRCLSQSVHKSNGETRIKLSFDSHPM